MGRVQRYMGVAATAEIFGTLSDASGPPLPGQGRQRPRAAPGPEPVVDIQGPRRCLPRRFRRVLRRGPRGVAHRVGRLHRAGPLPEEIDVPGMPVRPRRFTVKLEYHGRPFVSVPVEVAPDEAGLAAEHASSSDASSKHSSTPPATGSSTPQGASSGWHLPHPEPSSVAAAACVQHTASALRTRCPPPGAAGSSWSPFANPPMTSACRSPPKTSARRPSTK